MQTDNNSEFLPPLTAIAAPWMTEFLSDPAFLDELLQQHGSPINIIHTGPFGENYNYLIQAIDRHQLPRLIFFARKANRCKAFVKESKRLGLGVDTASYQELKECLELGCDPRKLVMTAAVKDEPLMRLAIEHDVLMVLDNEDECRLANQLSKERGKLTDIGVRISGFHDEGEKLYSRFGFDTGHVLEFITSRIGKEKDYGSLRFDGFHFHLNGYSSRMRSEALLQSIHLADNLLTQGIRTSFIDMGGGIPVNYLSSSSEWKTFWSELAKAVLRERSPITFGNTGLGYELINGQLHGKQKVYPYYNELSKGDFLDAVLSYQKTSGDTPASLLHARGIELRMEPGRSLLDQTGLTMAKVVHRKRDSNGDWLIGLAMNKSQLGSSSADFLCDPVLVQNDRDKSQTRPTPVFLTGGYCLEQDIILQRKIVLPCLPKTGDILVFLNTAGYLMHFYETRSHLFEFAKNLVMEENSGALAVY